MAETVPSWLNNEFFEKALNSNGKKSKTVVTSSDIKRAAAAGDHYGSEMYRAVLRTKENEKEEELSIIVKCELRSGEVSKVHIRYVK